jgi:hypothetical protein
MRQLLRGGRYPARVAKGKAVGRFEAVLGLVGLLALGATAVLITGWNPLPQVQTWFNKFGTPPYPAPWGTPRVGGHPTTAVVAGNAVVVSMRGTIEARGLSDGAVKWKREADWAGVAGDDSNAVAVVGRRGQGLEALDPVSGATKWKDGDAVGAWTYRDAVLTLTCPALSDCTLASRAPGDGATRWKSALPGIGRVLAGMNSDLLGSRLLSETYEEATTAVPNAIPSLLGFPTDQRVQVLDTGTGKRVREEKPSNTTRIVVVGGRILASTATPKDGNCRYTLEARDPANGKTVWKKDGYDLKTASGAGCEQRKDPAGGGNVLAATRGDNRELFLAARDGKELWVGAPGETAVATDGQYGVVRSADGKTIKVIDLGSGSKLWEQPAPDKAHIAVTRYALVVSDATTSTIKAYNPKTGSKIVDVKTGGGVIGYGRDGLMLGRGRTIGYVKYS